MAVVIAQRNQINVPQVRDLNQLAPQQNDLAARVLNVAFASLRYTALIAIAASSAYFLGQNFIGRCTIGFLSATTLSMGVSYAGNTISEIANQIVPPEKVAERADRAARVVLWSLLIVGGLTAGFAGGYVLSGATFLLSGSGETLSILNGLVDITFTFGYAIPLAQLFLRHSSFLYEGYHQLADRLANVIQEFRDLPQPAQVDPVLRVREQMQRVVGRLALFFGENLDFNTMLEVAEKFPEDVLRNQFLFNLPHLSDERVGQIVSRFKNTFSIQFLANELPEERFRRIVLPQLVAPLTSEQLENIAMDIEEKEVRMRALEQQGVENINLPQLQREVGQISAGLSQHRNNVLRVQEFIRRLPAQPLPERYRDVQEELERTRALEARVLEISQRLNQGEMWNRLQRLASQVAVHEEIDNSEDPNYEVLGALGFSIRHFRTLGNELGIPAEELVNREIERTCQFLNQRGLLDRAALVRNRILEVVEEGGRAPNPDEIIRRIVGFCGRNQPLLRPVEVPVEVRPVEVPQVQAQNPVAYPRLAAVARVVHDLFYVALSASLIAFQVMAQPISTVIGLSTRIVLGRREVNPDRLFHIYRLPPNYINQTFTERMRQLYIRISTVVWSVWFGGIGGFFMGMAHGNGALYYSRQLAARIRFLRN